MPLLLLRTGEIRKINRILGKDNIKQRIQDMGLVEGCQIEILSFLTGNVIVMVKGSKLAISNDVASRIHVI